MLIITFLISLLLEFFIFYFLLFKKTKNPNNQNKNIKILNPNLLKFLNLIISFNILTQLIFNFLIPFLNLNFIHYLVVSEFFIILVEAYILYYVFNKKIDLKKVFLISTLANLISWQFTPFVYYLLITLINLI